MYRENFVLILDCPQGLTNRRYSSTYFVLSNSLTGKVIT